MDSKRYICIFGGGAIRGVVYPGAVKALEELEIEIPTYVGSSVGAIFAALCSVGYKSSDLGKILHEFNAFMFKDINFSLGEFSLSKGEIFENWLREKIESAFYKDEYKKGECKPVKFSDIEKDIFVLATDIKTNKRFVFSKYSTPDFELAKAVRISSSFPGLMKPAEIDDRILVDGDLAKSLPLWKGIDDLKDEDCRILEFRLEGNCMNLKSVLDYMNTVYGSMSYFCSENLENIFGGKDKFDYILIDTKDVFLFDFQMSNDEKDKLAQIGYDTTIKYFTKTLVDKKRLLLPFYEKVYDGLKKLKLQVQKNNVKEIKNLLIKIALQKDEFSKNADPDLIFETKNVLANLSEDLSENLFGFMNSVNNYRNHLEKIEALVAKYEHRVSDVSAYIKEFSEKYV